MNIFISPQAKMRYMKSIEGNNGLDLLCGYFCLDSDFRTIYVLFIEVELAAVLVGGGLIIG
jgi:hypothetical protein